jgi:thiamine-phosphate pyrophosphorylase
VRVASIIAPLAVPEYTADTLINVIRYAITDEPGLYASEAELLQLAARWSDDSVNFVQLRARQMSAGPLTTLARKLIGVLSPQTKLLINGRADVAIAAGAAGVHLTAAPGELTPEQVRGVFALAGKPEPIISISCHTVEAAQRARAAAADIILFAPVFEKRIAGALTVDGVGLEALRQICEAALPVKVLALGGVTPDNAPQCISAGAAGVAGIRIFSNLELSAFPMERLF